MDTFIAALLIILSILLLAYFLVDVNYFIRSLLTIAFGTFFRKKLDFLGVSEIYGIVLPSDADTWLTHMNNARVFREFDFGRWDHFCRTGLTWISARKSAGGVVGAQTIRYRRPLHMFMTYKIVTQPVWWDDNSIYIEQQIVTLKDDIIRAVAYVKLVMNLDFNKLVAKHYPNTIKPTIPDDLEHWIKFNTANSKRLTVKRKTSNATEIHSKKDTDESDTSS